MLICEVQFTYIHLDSDIIASIHTCPLLFCVMSTRLKQQQRQTTGLFKYNLAVFYSFQWFYLNRTRSLCMLRKFEVDLSRTDFACLFQSLESFWEIFCKTKVVLTDFFVCFLDGEENIWSEKNIHISEDKASEALNCPSSYRTQVFSTLWLIRSLLWLRLSAAKSSHDTPHTHFYIRNIKVYGSLRMENTFCLHNVQPFYLLPSLTVHVYPADENKINCKPLINTEFL